MSCSILWASIMIIHDRILTTTFRFSGGALIRKRTRSTLKSTRGDVESFSDIVSYDLDSIMHYSNYACSETGKEKTIVAKNDPNKVLGQRKAMSPSDIKQLNLLYKCLTANTIPSPCGDVNNQSLLCRQKISMQFKARKWLSCDELSCK